MPWIQIYHPDYSTAVHYNTITAIVQSIQKVLVLQTKHYTLTLPGGNIITESEDLQESWFKDPNDLWLQVTPRLYVAKGGFGNLLKAGGRVKADRNKDLMKFTDGTTLLELRLQTQLHKWIRQKSKQANKPVENKPDKTEELYDTLNELNSNIIDAFGSNMLENNDVEDGSCEEEQIIEEPTEIYSPGSYTNIAEHLYESSEESSNEFDFDIKEKRNHVELKNFNADNLKLENSQNSENSITHEDEPNLIDKKSTDVIDKCSTPTSQKNISMTIQSHIYSIDSQFLENSHKINNEKQLISYIHTDLNRNINNIKGYEENLSINIMADNSANLCDIRIADVIDSKSNQHIIRSDSGRSEFNVEVENKEISKEIKTIECQNKIAECESNSSSEKFENTPTKRILSDDLSPKR